jgi:hypothetical protein
MYKNAKNFPYYPLLSAERNFSLSVRKKLSRSGDVSEGKA